MEMDRERAIAMALRDAEDESLENLEAASAMMDRRRGLSHHAIMVQDDVLGTSLPNGMLRWFGFDHDRAELPHEGLMPLDDPPTWVGTPPGFTLRTSVADASVTVVIDELDAPKTLDGTEWAHPLRYSVSLEAHGRPTEEFTCDSWPKVQRRCRQAAGVLDESHWERHGGCLDERGELSAEACGFCERGTPGG